MGNYTNANPKYLLVREGAENNLLVRQCTFVHAAAYCHTRDATQRCQFSDLQSEYFPSGLPMFLDYFHTLFPSNSPTDKSRKWLDAAIAAATNHSQLFEEATCNNTHVLPCISASVLGHMPFCRASSVETATHVDKTCAKHSFVGTIFLSIS
jgi:hypothetical protein